MRPTDKKRLASAVALVFAALLATPIARRLLGTKLPRFTYAFSELSAEARRGLVAKPHWELGAVQLAPDVASTTLLRRPQNAGAPWVVYFSGNDLKPLHTAQAFLERLRGDRDWGLASWTYRGAASTGGTPSPELLAADAAQVVQQLRKAEHIAADRVHLVAFSLGGYSAAKLSGDAARAKTPFASLSLLAAGEHFEMLLPGLSHRLLGGDVYEIGPLLDAVPAPALVVQGAIDEAIGVEAGRKIAARLGKRARYIELAGVDHNALLEHERTFEAVRASVEATQQ